MGKAKQTGSVTPPSSSRPIGMLLLFVLLAAVCAESRAGCFGDVTGDDPGFPAQLDGDPAAAAAALQASVDQGTRGTAQGLSLAHRYAMLMDAYERSHLIDKARDAAARGLESLTAGDSDALRRRLRLTRIGLLVEQGHITEAARDYDAAVADVPPDVPDYVCILMDLGILHMRAGREGDALRELLRGYQLADRSHQDPLRVDFGNVLSQVYVKYGFYDDALDLENSAIRSLQGSGDSPQLAAAYVLRGDALVHQQHLDDALASYGQGRSLYLRVHDEYNAAAASQLACAGLAGTAARAQQALSTCRQALAEAHRLGDAEGEQDLKGSLGEIALLQGHPQEALALLNPVLADHAVDLPPAREQHFHALRAQARGESGDTAGAWREMTDVAGWQRGDAAARQSGDVAVLRAKFGFELKERELRQAQAETAAAREHARREVLVRNVVIGAAALLLAFATATIWQIRRRRELQLAHDADRERVAALGRLAAGIAHEFNNALTVVQQAAGLLKARPSVRSDADAIGLIESIDQVSRDSAATTAQLQSFGRQQSLRPRATPLNVYLEQLRPRLEQAAGSGTDVRFEFAAPEPCAWVDERLLADALLSLVHNAKQAMSGRGTLGIRVFHDADQAPCIEVIDTGSGMAPAVLAHAAEPFFSTRPFGQGTGLGLSMVDGFVKQSGGTMTIQSEEGRGTTVRLRFSPVPKSA